MEFETGVGRNASGQPLLDRFGARRCVRHGHVHIIHAGGLALGKMVQRHRSLGGGFTDREHQRFAKHHFANIVRQERKFDSSILQTVVAMMHQFHSRNALPVPAIEVDHGGAWNPGCKRCSCLFETVAGIFGRAVTAAFVAVVEFRFNAAKRLLRRLGHRFGVRICEARRAEETCSNDQFQQQRLQHGCLLGVYGPIFIDHDRSVNFSQHF